MTAIGRIRDRGGVIAPAILGVVGLVVTSLLPFSSGAWAQSSVNPTFVPGELIIGYQSESDRQAALGELKAMKNFNLPGDEKAKNLAVEPIEGAAVKLRLELPAAMQAQASANPDVEREVLEALASNIKQSDARVKYAHPNWILTIKPPAPPVKVPQRVLPKASTSTQADAPNDPSFVRRLHWHYEAAPRGMNAVGAWQMTKGDANVIVAVLDTGILFDHPDLRGSANVLQGYNFISQGGVRSADATDYGDSPIPGSSSWHGTHVAGTIGAVGTNNGIGIAGVNWNVKILPVRVIGPSGGALSDIADAIRWAAGLPVNGAPSNSRRAHVINMSLGIARPCNTQMAHLAEAVEAARQAGSVVVAAAGNNAQDVSGFSPAGCPGVVSVAAHDQNGHLTRYSNYGAVTIMAPGGDTEQKDQLGLPAGVWSAVRVSAASPEGVAVYQGTSMAAPHVAGAIALAMARNPAWRFKPDDMVRQLTATASRPPENACPRPCGAGQLDAARLLEPAPVSVAKTETARPGGLAKATQPGLAKVAQATAEKPAGNAINGRWMLRDAEGVLEIAGSEWRHPSKGMARFVADASEGNYQVVYQAAQGVRCIYRISLLAKNEVLMLEPLDATQSRDFCPRGELARVAE